MNTNPSIKLNHTNGSIERSNADLQKEDDNEMIALLKQQLENKEITPAQYVEAMTFYKTSK